jgi:hypothetical protein
MSLYMCNWYPSKVWVAIMWFEPFCEGNVGNFWRRQGWFSLNPAVCKKVLPNTNHPDVGDDLSDINRYFCFFAIADDGAMWSGPYKRKVRNTKFDFPGCIGVTAENLWTAGFRLFDVDSNDDYTLSLIP